MFRVCSKRLRSAQKPETSFKFWRYFCLSSSCYNRFHDIPIYLNTLICIQPAPAQSTERYTSQKMQDFWWDVWQNWNCVECYLATNALASINVNFWAPSFRGAKIRRELFMRLYRSASGNEEPFSPLSIGMYCAGACCRWFPCLLSG